MRIAITGASGLIGTAVSARLAGEGHAISRLVRSRSAAADRDAIYWDPARGEMDRAGLAGHHVVINLAGENIFGIWTRSKRRRMRRSRVEGTRLLAEAIAAMPAEARPALLINASALGYYGDRPPDEPVTEESAPADRFMARLVRDWEAATGPAAEAGVRVALMRMAPVMDMEGIPLRLMTLATRLGLGATLGAGDQPFPWVTRDEIAHVVAFLLGRPDLAGPVNVVGREQVTNREFADTLARVLNRPRFLRIPAPVIRLLGELGDELLIGMRAIPAKLDAAGYAWRDPMLEPTLRRMVSG